MQPLVRAKSITRRFVKYTGCMKNMEHILEYFAGYFLQGLCRKALREPGLP
jgi:hypothetical protein